jgi:heme/copper-type cytochrome/quinol oxidase subunit 3
MKRNLMFMDWVNLVLAILLVISPWVLAFPAGAATYNAVIVGLVIGLVAIGAIVAFAQWEEWVNLILGAWAFISPFVLGFAAVTAAMWTHVIIGLVVAILAAIELWNATHQPSAHSTAG